MKKREAIVYVKKVPAAVLTRYEQPGSQRYELRYLPEYLERSPCHMVCYHMRPRPEPYYGAELFPFFTSLLPEGENLQQICRTFRLDEEDYFSQLLFLAQNDTIGDVTVKEVRES